MTNSQIILESQRRIALKYGYQTYDELLKETHDREGNTEKRLELMKFIIDELMHLVALASHNETLQWIRSEDLYNPLDLERDLDSSIQGCADETDAFLTNPLPSLMKKSPHGFISTSSDGSFDSKFKVGKGIQIFEVEEEDQHGTMRIDAPRGTKVKGLFDNGKLMNGTDSQQEYASKLILEDKVYTVDETVIGGWETAVYLEEFPKIKFNSVHFTEC